MTADAEHVRTLLRGKRIVDYDAQPMLIEVAHPTNALEQPVPQ
jgi:hypothetical protein